MKRMILLGVVLAVATGPAALAGGHGHEHEDIIVGRSNAGVLGVEYDFDEASVLPPVSGVLNGWAGDDPGFSHLEVDEPGEDFYMLGAGANIVFEIVDIDPALVGNPLTDSLDAIGDQFTLGDEELHSHIDWLINSDDPAFDPLQTLWEVDFKLVDTGSTNYGASPVYTWGFTNVPEPTAAILMLAGCTLIGMRRKS
jgi:hypothetical protein